MPDAKALSLTMPPSIQGETIGLPCSATVVADVLVFFPTAAGAADSCLFSPLPLFLPCKRTFNLRLGSFQVLDLRLHVRVVVVVRHAPVLVSHEGLKVIRRKNAPHHGVEGVAERVRRQEAALRHDPGRLALIVACSPSSAWPRCLGRSGGSTDGLLRSRRTPGLRRLERGDIVPPGQRLLRQRGSRTTRVSPFLAVRWSRPP